VATLGECSFQFMLDGEIVPFDAPVERTFPSVGQTLWIRLEYKDFYRIARASRVAIRGCDAEARLDAHDAKRPLRAFALRVIDELTWLGTRTAEDALDQAPAADTKGPGAGAAAGESGADVAR
jgi:hypothetical protein